MTDFLAGFVPPDLLAVAPRPPSRGETSAPTPLAAAFLAGLGVPGHAREAVGRLIVSADPRHVARDDGETWQWDAPGIMVRLSASADGSSDAVVRVASVQPEFVDGEVVQAKEIEA